MVVTLILLRIIMVILIATVVSRIPWSRRGGMSGVMRSHWGRLMIQKMTVKRGSLSRRLERLRNKQRNIILVLQHHLDLVCRVLFFHNDSGDVIVRLKVHHPGILNSQQGWMV